MTKAPHIVPLPPSALRRRVRLAGFHDTSELDPLDGRLGQSRALEALQAAVSLEAPGWHVCMLGSTGLGRHTLALGFLDAVARTRPPPQDWCYLHDFRNPGQPLVVALPAGNGRRLAQDLIRLLEDLLVAMPAAFQGAEYQRRATEIRRRLEQREEALTGKLMRQGEDKGVLVMRTEEGFSLVPQRDGRALDPDDYHALPEQERVRVDRAVEEMKAALEETLVVLPRWRLEMQRELEALERETARLVVAPMVKRLLGRWRDFRRLCDWLDELEEEVIRRLSLFRGGVEGEAADLRDPVFHPFQAHVLVDNGGLDGAPVVQEDNPTVANLLGRMAYVTRMGSQETDHTLLRPGALHRANGGFLVLDLSRLMENAGSWEALKRALRAREVRFEPPEEAGGAGVLPGLDPEPVPLDCKVVLVAEREMFYLLRQADPEFALLFKVVADLAETLPRDESTDRLMARRVAELQRRARLRPLERHAVERVLEERLRHAGRGDRYSLHLDSLLDLLRESDLQARRGGGGRIEARHVAAALAARQRRLDRLPELMQEVVLRGLVRIDTEGLQLGQVNALTVVEAGDNRFGLPVRVTATARLGGGEFVDIERETELGGPIHAKGVFILTAYLAARYARHAPLPVTATLVFEQSYDPVEGDSASLAELCALVSALGDLPLKQAVAVTGSVNQHGQVQSVGGVCEKVEGFFRLCRARGLHGGHGVILPASDVPDLMLDPDLVAAVEQGRFRVWAVDHAEQALELLTGLPAGVADAQGNYPEGTVNGAVQSRLLQWVRLRRQYEGEKGDG